MEDEIESTLWIGGDCSCLDVPPMRTDRILSGEWRTDATICSNQRLRVTSSGRSARVYIESKQTGELFAVCPVPPGKKSTYILPAVDSSRNFLVRIEDAESGRHAFIGLSFTERGDAFDFNVALADHERQALAVQNVATAKPGQPATPEKDLSLREGQTIRVELKGHKGKSPAASPGGNAPKARLAVPIPPPGRPLSDALMQRGSSNQTSAALKPQHAIAKSEAGHERRTDLFANLASGQTSHPTKPTPSTSKWTTFD